MKDCVSPKWNMMRRTIDTDPRGPKLNRSVLIKSLSKPTSWILEHNISLIPMFVLTRWNTYVGRYLSQRKFIFIIKLWVRFPPPYSTSRLLTSARDIFFSFLNLFLLNRQVSHLLYLQFISVYLFLLPQSWGSCLTNISV